MWRRKVKSLYLNDTLQSQVRGLKYIMGTSTSPTTYSQEIYLPTPRDLSYNCFLDLPNRESKKAKVRHVKSLREIIRRTHQV